MPVLVFIRVWFYADVAVLDEQPEILPAVMFPLHRTDKMSEPLAIVQYFPKQVSKFTPLQPSARFPRRNDLILCLQKRGSQLPPECMLY